MPEVDTTFIIGVLREWERGLLQEDEFTRIVEAKSVQEAVHTLVDTPYGSYIDSGAGDEQVFGALVGYLNFLRGWLADKLVDKRVLQFIAARYDALNIGTSLLQLSDGAQEPGELSVLADIPADVLHSSIWHDLGWDQMPEFWERVIKEIKQEKYEPTILLEKIAEKAVVWQESLAFTPLMERVVDLMKEKLVMAAATRPYHQEEGAMELEKQWDEKLMAVVRQYKSEPVGYDPIIAFWYAKELEVKNLRLLLTAKFAGRSFDEIRKMQRSLYRSLG